MSRKPGKMMFRFSLGWLLVGLTVAGLYELEMKSGIVGTYCPPFGLLVFCFGPWVLLTGLLICGLGLIGAMWAQSWGNFVARNRRVRKGYCHTCGYNLTGNVSGICPECGEKIGNK